ncbi:MAG TPA: 50S ribosomal protein L29 [Candidatus Magasanikbacteria bacterium]|mgnify:CR=1 FL=1|nr:50S ribosomal protein L29 [Candidatus Magasanikbacteria bacterium]
MKATELKQKTKEELEDILKREQEKKRELRFRASSRELKNVKEIDKTKKTIARIKTVLKALN